MITLEREEFLQAIGKVYVQKCRSNGYHMHILNVKIGKKDSMPDTIVAFVHKKKRKAVVLMHSVFKFYQMILTKPRVNGLRIVDMGGECQLVLFSEREIKWLNSLIYRS